MAAVVLVVVGGQGGRRGRDGEQTDGRRRLRVLPPLPPQSDVWPQRQWVGMRGLNSPFLPKYFVVETSVKLRSIGCADTRPRAVARNSTHTF